MKNLKLLFLLLCILPILSFSQINTLNKIFDDYQDQEGITSIKIAKPMFDMLKGMDIGNEDLEDIKPVLDKINSIRILILEKPQLTLDSIPNPIQVKRNLLIKSQISSAVNRLHYEELMTINSSDNKIKFLSANANSETVENLLLNIDSDESSVLIMLDGIINMTELANLINESDED